MRRAVTLALLAVSLILVLAVPASAQHRQFRVGVTELPERSAQDMAAMASTGVGVLRVNFSWVRIEDAAPVNGACGTARYNWDAYDELVREATIHGVRLLPVIVGSPSYVSPRSTQAPYSQKVSEIVPYKCFLRASVARYGRGGFLPRTQSARPITDWQVWNEPNFTQFGTNELGPDPREYAELVETSSNQIRRIDERATIALGGMPGDPRPFLRGIYRSGGIERKFDVVALHPYAFDFRGVKGAVTRFRSTLADLGDRGRYLWITETGWATQGRSLKFLVKSHAGQAEQLRKTYGMLRANRREWRVGTVAWFRWRDTAAPSENRGPFDYAGLYGKGGQPKGSCEAYARLTPGARCSAIP